MSKFTCDGCGQHWLWCNCPPRSQVPEDRCNTVAPQPPTQTPPMNKIFRVQIVAGGNVIERNVVARSDKAALLKVIESIPDDHFAWQAPGWQSISVCETREPIIL